MSFDLLSRLYLLLERIHFTPNWLVYYLEFPTFRVKKLPLYELISDYDWKVLLLLLTLSIYVKKCNMA